MNTRRSNYIRTFGAFEVELSAGELRKSGLKLRIPEQSFQLLALLLERPGQLVSRDDMRRRLWPGGIHVDFDHGINKAMTRLRAILGDSATHPHFIETVARRGYRLLAPVGGPESQRLARPRGKIRLAVLPFESLGVNPVEDHFSDGLTEELTSQLGQIDPERLGVIARTSTTMYKRCKKRIDEIGAELNADYIVEGSVRRAGDRVRVSIQLIEVRGQTHRWAENYQRVVSDIFAVQAEISRLAAQVIALDLLLRSQGRHDLVRTGFEKFVSALESEDSAGRPLRPVQ